MKIIFFIIPDLSECQLIQVPDAVFHLMRHTELKTCDLSCNVITKIPPKIAVKFNFITGMSHQSFNKNKQLNKLNMNFRLKLITQPNG